MKKIIFSFAMSGFIYYASLVSSDTIKDSDRTGKALTDMHSNFQKVAIGRSSSSSSSSAAAAPLSLTGTSSVANQFVVPIHNDGILSKTPIFVRTGASSVTPSVLLKNSPMGVANIALTPAVTPISFISRFKQDILSSGINVEFVDVVCDEYDYPTVESFEALLNSKYEGSKYTVHEIPVDKFSRVYSALSESGQNFFLKISNNEDTSKNLAAVQEQFIKKMPHESANSNSASSVQAGYPIITKVERFFIYKCGKSHEEIIEVTQAAQGQSISDIFNNGKNFVNNIQTKKECLHAVGRALGLFQQAFMIYRILDKPESWLTASHNDLHPDNVFYDQHDSQVYFIDNETMRDRCSVLEDFNTFIFDNLFLYNCVNKNKNNYKIYLDLYCAFLEGYLASFPTDKIIPLGLYLKKVTTEKLAQAHVFLDDATYHYNYIHEILDFNITKIMLSIQRDAIQEKFDLTPLHLAVVERSIDKINKLLGADDHANAELINTEDLDGFTPLFWALAQGDADIMKLLCRPGVDLNASIDLFDNTLLHYAAAMNYGDIVSVLLAAGADVKALNDDDKTPLDIAVDNQSQATIALLQAVEAHHVANNNSASGGSTHK